MLTRIFGWAACLAALVLLLVVPTAYGQLPSGPTTVVKTTFAVDNPPPDFQVVQDVTEFAPGAWTPTHVHGGAAYITVVQGELAYRSGGTTTTYKVGDKWTEKPGDLMQVGNVTSSSARTLVTFLLPKGAQLTTAQEVAGIQAPSLQPKKIENKFAVSNPPSQFDLIEVQQDFAPTVATPIHTHGGPAFITVLSGEVTLRGNGTKTTYHAGDSWTETPGQYMQVANLGTAPASTFVTFLLPKGATLTTTQPQEAPATNPSSTPVWLYPSLGLAAVIVLGGGALLVRRRFAKR